MRDVAELNGDGIAPELRDAVHLLNEALGSPVAFQPIDWRLERREAGESAGAARNWPRHSHSSVRGHLQRTARQSQ